MDNCIFCKIVAGEIPSTKVYEDESFFAFLDIQPISDGHMLLVPKEHIIWMQEAPDALIAAIFVLTKKLMLAIQASTGCDFVQIGVVGQDVPHFHIHLMPRYHADGIPNAPVKNFDQEKSNTFIEKIKQQLL